MIDRAGQSWMRLNEHPMTRVFLYSWCEGDPSYVYSRVYDVYDSMTMTTVVIERYFVQDTTLENWTRIDRGE